MINFEGTSKKIIIRNVTIPLYKINIFDDYFQELHSRFIPILSEPERWVMDGKAGYISSFHYAKYTVSKLNGELRQPMFHLMKVVWQQTHGY